MWSEDDEAGAATTSAPVSGFNALSAWEQRLLLSDGVLHSLLLGMDSQQMRVAVGYVISSAVAGSRERSETAIAAVVGCIRDLTALPATLQDHKRCPERVAVKSLLRSVIVLGCVEDALTEWRVDRVASAVTAATQDAAGDTDDSGCSRLLLEGLIEALPRWCRLCPALSLWLAQNDGCLEFIAQYFHSRIELEEANCALQLGKLNDVLDKLQKNSGGACVRKLNFTKDHQVEHAEGGLYCDSDDEPQTLVGRRVAVQWSGGQSFNGTVSAFHSGTGLHDVRYDDGDLKSYTLSNAYSTRSVEWRLLM